MKASIQAFATLLSIAHHIPGRIRLKLSETAAVPPRQAIAAATAFCDAVGGVDGIHKVSMNPLARSCVVEYDPSRFGPQSWVDLVEGRHSDAAETLLQALAHAAGVQAS